MTTLEAAEQVVKQLSATDLDRFRRWFAEFDSQQWDAQIEADALQGKLQAYAAEALAEYHAGKATEI